MSTNSRYKELSWRVSSNNSGELHRVLQLELEQLEQQVGGVGIQKDFISSMIIYDSFYI